MKRDVLLVEVVYMAEIEKVMEFAILYANDVASELAEAFSDRDIEDIKELKINEIDQEDNYFLVSANAIIFIRGEIRRDQNGEPDPDNLYYEKAYFDYKILETEDGFKIDYFREPDGRISFEETFKCDDDEGWD